MSSAKSRQPIFRKVTKIVAVDDNVAAIGSLKARERQEEGRFTSFISIIDFKETSFDQEYEARGDQ